MEVRVSWFTVEDIEKAKKFYGDVLGLKKTFEMSGWVMFSHADDGPSIGLTEMPKNGETGATVVLRVPDIEIAKKQLSDSGVTFDNQEEVPGIVRLASFRDPEGNRLQIMQRLIP